MSPKSGRKSVDSWHEDPIIKQATPMNTNHTQPGTPRPADLIGVATSETGGARGSWLCEVRDDHGVNVIAYHFVGDTLRDGRPVPPDGEWLEHDGELRICESGLHASRHPFDALMYAPGSTLCFVECDGIGAEHDDKFVCSRRRIIRRIDARPLLCEFSRWCALQVIDLWDAPEVVKRYLESGDESLRDAAMAAAADAGTAAAAAWAAARAAAMAAQREKFAELVDAAFKASDDGVRQ